MPLRASISGKDVQAFELSPPQWSALRDRLRGDRTLGRMPCCDAPVIAKTSKLGTQFFSHYTKGECSSVPESEAHRIAKRAVYDGCIDAGWEASTEAVAPDGAWRADVLASKNQTVVAFEIQLSRQSEKQTLERHHSFTQNKVRCCWLFRRLPFAQPKSHVPAFLLVEAADGSPPAVMLGLDTLGLREFVHLILSERIRYCAVLIVRPEAPRWSIRRGSCPHCSVPIHFASVIPPPLVSVCGLPLSESEKFNSILNQHSSLVRWLESLSTETVPLNAEQLEAAPNLLLQSPPGKPFLTGAGRSGFCPACVALVPITDESDRLPVVVEVDLPVRSRDWPSTYYPHWCVGSDGVYCSNAIPRFVQSETETGDGGIGVMD